MLKRLIGIIVSAVALLLLVNFMLPVPKCGDVGYYPKLSAGCRAAADSKTYCTPAELADIQCAQSTFEASQQRDADRVRRQLSERS